MKILKNSKYRVYWILLIGLLALLINDTIHEVKESNNYYSGIPEGYHWVVNLRKNKPIDFLAQNWPGSVKEAFLGINRYGRKQYRYTSPSGKYKVSYKKNSNGFIISDTRSGKIALESPHWVINPERIKWLFKEQYIVYQFRKDLDDPLWIYIGNLKTNEIQELVSADDR